MSQTEKSSLVTCATFEDFWSIYPRKMSRKDAMKAWNSLSCSDRSLAMQALPNHLEYWKAAGTEKQFLPYPATWLRGERFHDELEMPQPKAETGWMKSEQGILSEGKRRGVHPKPGESLWEYRDRVLAA